MILDGHPLYRFIVEGANLFITQEARLRLEEKGIILIKDASANKGGVTSSSLEVLASMALTPEEYGELMVCQSNEEPSLFRKAYVEEVLARISGNADLEFEALWREHEKRKTPFSILSDQLSNKINKVTDDIYNSTLFEKKELVAKILNGMIPKILVEKVGMETLMQRIPEAYLRAMFSTGIANKFVYKRGLGAGEIDFFNHLNC